MAAQRPARRHITIRELLGHTSGVYNYFENPHYNDLVFNRRSHRWTFNEIIGLVRQPYCASGSCYHYSNTNFVLAGRVAELVTGKSIADLDHAIGCWFRMGSTTRCSSRTSRRPADAAARLSVRHGLDPQQPGPADDVGRDRRVGGGRHGLDTTDLARWATLLYTGKVVPQPLLDQMLSVRKCHDNYGLGTRWMVINGRAADGHLGSLRGYNDAMWYFPREGAAIVLLSNQGAWSPDSTIRRLSTTLFNRIGAPAPQYDSVAEHVGPRLADPLLLSMKTRGPSGPRVFASSRVLASSSFAKTSCRWTTSCRTRSCRTNRCPTSCCRTTSCRTRSCLPSRCSTMNYRTSCCRSS